VLGIESRRRARLSDVQIMPDSPQTKNILGRRSVARRRKCLTWRPAKTGSRVRACRQIICAVTTQLSPPTLLDFEAKFGSTREKFFAR
jgi:hypothetical protein